jgi:hypothetical protein
LTIRLHAHLTHWELRPNNLLSQTSRGDLSKFNTIILDNRSYEAHPELIPVNDRLLKYAEDGGTLLVFYHKTGEWNPDERQKRPQLAPYSIVLSDDRVTEEDAPIGVLQPHHPLSIHQIESRKLTLRTGSRSADFTFRRNGTRTIRRCLQQAIKEKHHFEAACS